MNTAEDILDSHYNKNLGALSLTYEGALEAMKQIAELAFDAGLERCHDINNHGKRGLKLTAPSKDKFILQLFPEQTEKEEDYDLPMDWEPNYNAETPEERRDEAIKQQKLK